MNHNRTCLFVLMLLLAAGSATAQSGFQSGSNGSQGAFPPASLGGGYTTLTLDLKTGVVTSNGGEPHTATISGGSGGGGDAFGSGDFNNFTTFAVPASVTLKILPNSQNTPVTIRTSGDVNIAGTIDLRGGNGGPTSLTGISVAGKGGVGGAAGGQGGVQAVADRRQTEGGPGLGRHGGAPGFDVECCDNGAASGQGGSFPHSNSNLLPLIGGSGGGGGRGADSNASYSDHKSGAGGGGGGGAILIASTTQISVTGSILVNGGAGGPSDCGNFQCGKGGGGGSGGAIRLMANTVTLHSTSTLNAVGGAAGSNTGSAGGPGMIRVEGVNLDVAPEATVTPAALSGPPGIIRPLNLPSIQITSIGGICIYTPTASPCSLPLGGGNTGTVDFFIGSGGTPPTNPMEIIARSINIPDGTCITFSLKTSEGGAQTQDGYLSEGTASVSLTLPTGVSYIQASSAPFDVSDAGYMLPLFNGEKILTASAEFDGQQSRAYFYTASGTKVSADQLFAQR